MARSLFFYRGRVSSSPALTIVDMSVCLSVRPIHAGIVYCVKTTQARITKSSPSDSPGTYLGYLRFIQKFNLKCDRIFRAKRQLSLIPLNRMAALPAALSNLTRTWSESDTDVDIQAPSKNTYTYRWRFFRCYRISVLTGEPTCLQASSIRSGPNIPIISAHMHLSFVRDTCMGVKCFD